jgi:hypothetical protein
MKIELSRSELIKTKGEITLSLPSIEGEYSIKNATVLNRILTDIITKKIEGEDDENT